MGWTEADGDALFPNWSGLVSANGETRQFGAMDLPAQHCHLVPQYQQFDVLGAAVSGELGQHLQDLPQQLVYQRRAQTLDPHHGPTLVGVQRRTSANPTGFASSTGWWRRRLRRPQSM
jgi:hypothetical protein